MFSQLAVPFHFAAEFVVLAVCLGAAFESARREGTRSIRVAATLGFAALASAQFLHGSRLVDPDGAGVLIGLRTAGYLLLLAPLPRRRAEMPAVFFVGGRAAGWSAIPALAAVLVGVRAILAHRKDPDPKAVAYAAAFLAFGAAEAATALGGPQGGAWLSVAHGARATGAVLLARWLWTAIARSIRLRFVAAFIAGLVVLVLLISTSLTAVIAGNVERSELSRVRSATMSAKQALEPFVRRAVTASATVAEAIPSLVKARDVVALRGLAERQLKRLLQDLDFLVVVDATGRPMADAASSSGADGEVIIGRMQPGQLTPLTGSDLVALALDSAKGGVTLDTAGPNLLVLVSAAPVLDRGETIGAVVLGYRLDGVFLSEILRGSGYHGTIVLGGGIGVAASTLPAAAARAAFTRAGLRRGLRAIAEGQEGFTTSASVAGRPYFHAFVPLLRSDRQVVAVLGISGEARAASVTQSNINKILFLVTLLAAAAAAAIAWWTGGRITDPIRSLRHATEQVRSGDLAARAEVSSSDEVGALGAAFNDMTASMARMTDDLRDAAEEEASLRERMEAIMQSMGDGLVATDLDGRVVAFNRAAEQIVGIPPSAVIGRPLGEVLIGAGRSGRPLAEMAMEGAGEAELRRENGRVVPVALTSAPLRDAGGKPGGRVVVFRDISREAEAERMKSEFLSNVSHELRTPLTPIRGYAEILRRKAFPRDKQMTFLNGILESTTRLERIVEILVDFAAMEAGRLRARPEPIQLRAFVAPIVDRWRDRAPTHTFNVTVPASLPVIDADPRLLSKCLDELLDNAVKFSSPELNGSRRRPKVEVEAEVVRRGGRRRMRLGVIDHGIGIPDELLHSVFQEFKQADGSETRAFGGLGLGLAYAKRVVDVHKGEITVESRPGRGSTFSVLLPMGEGRRVPAAGGNGTKRRVAKKASSAAKARTAPARSAKRATGRKRARQ